MIAAGDRGFLTARRLNPRFGTVVGAARRRTQQKSRSPAGGDSFEQLTNQSSFDKASLASPAAL
jgi:hypothetical protein